MRPGTLRAGLVAVLADCGLARLAYLTSSVVQFNADEAVTGLMVREILDGRLPVFYAGQQYGGALEQYLEAALYALTPLPQTELTLRLPLLALSVLTCLLVYLIAREVLASPGRALLAAALYAVGPWFNILGGVTSLGFYVAGQALATAAVWTALRGRLFRTGLLAGLAVWTAVSALYVLVPVALWLLPELGRDGRRWARTAAGFGLGALPLLGWLAVHRVLPVPGTPAEDSSIPRRLANLADPVLRQFVGVAYGHAEGGLWLPVQVALVLILAGGYVAALVRRRGFALLRADRRPADLLLAVPPVVVVLWAASNSTWYTGTPRYLALTYPLLAVGLAALVPVRSAPVLVAGTALLSAGFFPTMAGVGPTTATRDAVFRQVADQLVARGQGCVYADYWTAMPLQYLAGDRLTVAVYDGAGRFPRAQAAVAACADPVYVGNAWGHSDGAIRARLDQLGVAYRTRTVDFVTIFEPAPSGGAR